MAMLEAVFWTCLGLIVYHHVLYPPLLRALAVRCVTRPVMLEAATRSGAPLSMTMIIPAHNEEAVIGAKLENCARLHSPGEFRVFLFLDGCTDGTAQVARETLAKLPQLNCTVFESAVNVGKVNALNQAIAVSRSDLIGVSDASSILDQNALIRLASHFEDEAIGVVCPTYQVPDQTLAAEQAYWDYQRRVKADEAALAAPMGAHGACYLFRRRLWRPLAPDTINDDFVLPMMIVASGYNAVYDLKTVCVELEPTTVQQNFARRVRIGAGNLQQVLMLPRLGDPRRPRLAFVFLSGKGLRAFMPLLLGLMAISAVCLAIAGRLEFRILNEVIVAGLTFLAVCAIRPHPRLTLFALPVYVVQSYLAAGLGCLLLLSGRTDRAWTISQRLFITDPRRANGDTTD